ncbi:hypothetical protein [Companilactobacillus ginsenosidimutans]|uniref:Uncharacterized protein n=1 Tax=Companilactobacillus ginsenosidimutans TaxID=1007676 RepID=A0A0H4QL82_9LACO|nr:hypothetical protein [Companilactobacillus ginsenosidimutans]AKP67458.1 hypothetical protein ABM34_07900 [Companilactobacillus ginsenosidimutans]
MEIDESKIIYICEVCGAVRRYKTVQEAYDDGWDYPPKMGVWGVVSPRKCGNCGITETAYWKLATGVNPVLTEHEKKTIERIIGEPWSVLEK